MGQNFGGDNLDQTKSIVQAKDGGFVTVGWSRSNAFMINRNKVARIGLLNLKYVKCLNIQIDL
jgi:hypothetical protein